MSHIAAKCGCYRNVPIYENGDNGTDEMYIFEMLLAFMKVDFFFLHSRIISVSW